MEADAITGPWQMVHEEIRPAGMAAGDFDLVADPDTGKAYMYFEHDHKEVICIELTDDYRNVTNCISAHLPGRAPNTAEGIACFLRDAKIYLTRSGMTGHFPNPSLVSVADGFHGPFRDIGLLHLGDRTETSFGSQISDIFNSVFAALYAGFAGTDAAFSAAMAGIMAERATERKIMHAR